MLRSKTRFQPRYVMCAAARFSRRPFLTFYRRVGRRKMTARKVTRARTQRREATATVVSGTPGLTSGWFCAITFNWLRARKKKKTINRVIATSPPASIYTLSLFADGRGRCRWRGSTATKIGLFCAPYIYLYITPADISQRVFVW